MKQKVGVLIMLCGIGMLAGQSPSEDLPCPFTGELLRDRHHKVVHYTSPEMKARAVHKVDIGGFVKSADVNGTVIADVLVSASGNVVCLKSRKVHPLLQGEVEKALRQWTFRAVQKSGKSWAYLGTLQFRLCNINCGPQGTSMTITR